MILKRFREAKVTTSERQKSMGEAARNAQYGDAQEVAAGVDRKGKTARRGNSEWHEAADEEEVHLNAKRLLSERSSQTGASRWQPGQDDADFFTDIEVAKQLSLAEQRGYGGHKHR
jgi:hypothetical protein